MTDEIAEKLIDSILELRRNGIKDNDLIVKELQQEFEGDEDTFYK